MRHRVRGSLLPLALVLSVAAGGCEFDRHTVGSGSSRAVVHAVLNPSTANAGDYVVLLERTLTGRVSTRSEVRDPADPIASGGGEAISGARVELQRIDVPGAIATGIEDLDDRPDRKGAGVYRFVNLQCGPFNCPPNALSIARGARYRLRVTLPGGLDVVEGETTVPLPATAPDTLPGARFDAERDTIRLQWPSAGRAHRYVLQIQTPYGPFQIFSDTNALVLTGGLRNFQSQRLPPVFTPGFLQAVQIAAVDTNFYNYYRTRNDPFTGSGLVTGLRGGTGVFGSYAPIRRNTFDVVARQDEAIEGAFAGGGERITLYAQGSGFVSGRWDDGIGVRHGVLGTREGNRMRLIVLQRSTVNDTMFVREAEVVADTLMLRSGSDGPVIRFRRVP